VPLDDQVTKDIEFTRDIVYLKNRIKYILLLIDFEWRQMQKNKIQKQGE
jgi:hypothetical protein